MYASLMASNSKYTEPKEKLSRDLNGTISTFAFINSFYSYLLLHNDWKSIHQSSCTVWKSLISFDISVSFEVGVDFFFSFVTSMPTANIPNSFAKVSFLVQYITSDYKLLSSKCKNEQRVITKKLLMIN